MEGFFLPLSMRRKKNTRIRFKIVFLVIILLSSLFLYDYYHRKPISVRIDNLPELAEGFSTFGIDVSHHQNEIDWNTVLTAGDSVIRFVYCKATEGISLVDSKWYLNRNTLNDALIPNGAYHFFIPNLSVTKQAANFLKHYQPRKGDLPPVIDVEIEDGNDQTLVEKVKSWINLVEESTGLRPVIYTSHYLYKTKFKGQFTGYKFWIANYNKQVDGLDDPAIIHWQFSEHGSIPGIDGDVDLNCSKIAYN